MGVLPGTKNNPHWDLEACGAAEAWEAGEDGSWSLGVSVRAHSRLSLTQSPSERSRLVGFAI